MTAARSRNKRRRPEPASALPSGAAMNAAMSPETSVDVGPGMKG
jgi:hypothetical protein